MQSEHQTIRIRTRQYEDVFQQVKVSRAAAPHDSITNKALMWAVGQISGFEKEVTKYVRRFPAINYIWGQ